MIKYSEFPLVPSQATIDKALLKTTSANLRVVFDQVQQERAATAATAEEVGARPFRQKNSGLSRSRANLKLKQLAIHIGLEDIPRKSHFLLLSTERRCFS